MTLISQLASHAAFGLEIANARVVRKVVLCTLLGALYAAIAIAVAGLVGRLGPVLAVGPGLALLGYLATALRPLSSVLESSPWVSPWDWALGGHPLFNPTEAARYVALVAPTVVLTLVRGIGFARGDVRSA